MTAQHTPGPWTGFLHERAPGEASWLIGPSSARPIVAAVEADEEAGLTGAVVEANARLIAAAPELLDALKAAEDLFGIEFTYSDGRIVEGSPSVGTEWVRQARAAIAKAEGREP